MSWTRITFVRSPDLKVSRMLGRVSRLRGRGVADLLYSMLWKMGIRVRASSAVHEQVFTRIYKHNEWGGEESRSGPGSSRARGSDIAQPMAQLFAPFSISSLLDAPCGDFNWMQHVTGPLQSYVGVDVVPALIARNQELYANDKQRFMLGDITSSRLPQADMILCRDALVHLSYRDIWAAIANFKRTGSEYLLATTFHDARENADCRAGGWRALNLQIEPFNFPEPLAVIHDIPKNSAGQVPDKRLALWRLADLPVAAD